MVGYNLIQKAKLTFFFTFFTTFPRLQYNTKGIPSRKMPFVLSLVA